LDTGDDATDLFEYEKATAFYVLPLHYPLVAKPEEGVVFHLFQIDLEAVKQRSRVMCFGVNGIRVLRHFLVLPFI